MQLKKVNGRSKMKISDTCEFIVLLIFYDENFSVTLWLCAYTEVLPNANQRLSSSRVAVYHLETAYCWRRKLPHPPVVEMERLLQIDMFGGIIKSSTVSKNEVFFSAQRQPHAVPISWA